MPAELGQFALAVALMFSVLQAAGGLWGAQRRDVRLTTLADAASIGQLVFIVAAFGALMYAFATTDTSVAVVAENSHTAKPAIYKFTGVWANHEGSMLLWVLILSVFGAMVTVLAGGMAPTMKARVVGVQGLMAGAFLAFIIATSNPFARLSPAPLDGAGLNPLLQDPGLVLHPPFLYLGYVGFSVSFAFAVAALLEGRVDAAWARWLRPWTLAAWSLLTIGITLGSGWAYYELGWGGWWYWDPVENASLMPWLAGTALLHSALVVERRHTMVKWTILLAILTFTLSLIGTFLVRSGVLTSVHAFAVDPARGVFILAIIVGTTGSALTLFALRANAIARTGAFGVVSREGGLVANNLFLLVITATVFLGTFYPLAVDALTSDKISVGPPYYHLTVTPLAVALFLVMGLGPSLKWRADEPRRALRAFRWPLLVAIVAAAAVGVVARSFGGALGTFLAAWLALGTFAAFAKRVRAGEASFADSVRLARRLPRAAYGLFVAHLGMAVFIAGATGVSAWTQESFGFLRVGDAISVARYELVLADVRQSGHANYDAETATFHVRRDGRAQGDLTSERRFYFVRGMATTEAGIRGGPLGNLYVAFGDPEGSDAWSVHVYRHPLAIWIWSGGLIMALGGFVSLSDRRIRVGAPHRVRAPSSNVAPPAAPAE